MSLVIYSGEGRAPLLPGELIAGSLGLSCHAVNHMLLATSSFCHSPACQLGSLPHSTSMPTIVPVWGSKQPAISKAVILSSKQNQAPVSASLSSRAPSGSPLLVAHEAATDLPKSGQALIAAWLGFWSPEPPLILHFNLFCPVLPVLCFMGLSFLGEYPTRPRLLLNAEHKTIGPMLLLFLGAISGCIIPQQLGLVLMSEAHVSFRA